MKQIIDRLKSWHQDRKEVSMEKYEVKYIRELARKYLKQTEGEENHHHTEVVVSSLRKLCFYVLKTKPKTR
jgi:hypothetical protein